MTTDQLQETKEATHRSRRWAVREPGDRLLTGLSAGLARQWGIPAAYVRAGFVVASFALGAGAIVYVVLWALTLDRDPDAPDPEPKSPSQQVGLLLMYIGAMLSLRALEFWSSDDIVFSSAFLAFGIAAMWDRSDPAARTKIARLTGAGEQETTRIRVIGGGLLMLAGFAVFVGSIDALAGIGPILFAVALTIAGFMILFGPLVWRMGRDLADERRSRIRSDERAEMAAHLHDSVLQTLALIQRTDDPKRMVTLARGQERELRDWLYGKGTGDEADELGEAVRDLAGRVERDHDIPVDVVVVGDAPLDDSLTALAQAAGEAMTNAAKHSGAGKVSVYVEVTDDVAEIYIGDTGTGFDAGEIEGLGRGIDHSIVNRMTRHGGEARITSERGEGTEVELRMPRTT